MPLDPKKTKNGVNLNEIDVSKLALVDKEGLIDDLGKRLKTEIKGAFTEAIKSVKPEIKGIVDDAVKSQNSSSGGSQAPSSSTKQQTTSSGGGGNSGGGGTPPPNPPKPPKPPKTPKQPKAPKVPKPQMNPGGGNVYSDIGKEIAENLDELTESYQTLNLKELELAQKRLSDVQESIRFSTFGKEQALLSAATADLEKELANEAKKRGTTLGKIGNFLDRENINAASIITGIFSDSPMVGLMTKAVMESIRHKRAAAQKQKSDQLKIGDIKQHLPRPDDFHQQNQQQTAPQAPQQPQTQQQAPQQPPQQATQPAQPQAQSPTPVSPQEQQPNPKGPAQVHNIGDYADRRPPERVNDEEDDEEGKNAEMVALRLHKQSKRRARGNYQREKYDQGYEQGKKAELEKLHAELEEAKKKAEEIKKNPPEPKPGEDIFGTPDDNAESDVRLLEHKVASIQKLLDDIEKQKADEADENKRALEYASKGERKQNNLVEMKPKAPERVQQEPIVMGKAALEHNADPETQLHPEREELGDNKIVSILSGMKTTEEKESKTLDVFSFKNKNNRINPFLELRKLSQQQLTELEKISSIMALQLEQAKLANDAAQRETKEKGLGGEGGGGGIVEGAAKKKTKESGGLGIMDAIFGGVEGLHGVQLLTQGIKGIKNFGKNLFKGKGAKGAEKVAEGVGEGAKVAEGVGEGAKVAEGAGKGAEALKTVEGVGKGAEAVKEVGFMSKLLGKVPGGEKALELGSKIPGMSKLGGAAKGLGKVAPWLQLVLSGLDFHQGYKQAASFIGKKESDVDTGDKIGSGGANVVGNIVGSPIDMIGALFGQDLNTTGYIRKKLNNAGQAIKNVGEDGPVQATQTESAKKLQDRIKKLKEQNPGMTDAVARSKAIEQLLAEKAQSSSPTSPTPAAPQPAPSTSPTPAAPQPAPSTSPTPAPTTPAPSTSPVGGSVNTTSAGVLQSTTSPFSTSLTKSSTAMNKGARLAPSSVKGTASQTTGEVAAAAMEAEKETGFPAKVIMAQFALESNRGKSVTGDYNFFGVTGSGTAGSKMVKTREEITPEYAAKHFPDAVLDSNQSGVAPGKKRYIVHRPFAAYKSVKDSVDQHIKLLSQSKRYKPAFEKYKKTKDADQLMRDIAAAGYATGNNYGDHLVKVSQSSDLVSALSGGTTPTPANGQTQPPKTELASAAPVQQPPTPPEAGKRLTQASMQNTDLVRTASAAPPPANSQNVFAPSNVTQNTSILPGVKAQNTESTYQRTMDQMYVAT
jgi:flagellum-specific peptidoglycan hydrolase FlgJ